jgi:hypothetical protein
LCVGGGAGYSSCLEQTSSIRGLNVVVVVVAVVVVGIRLSIVISISLQKVRLAIVGVLTFGRTNGR